MKHSRVKTLHVRFWILVSSATDNWDVFNLFAPHFIHKDSRCLNQINFYLDTTHDRHVNVHEDISNILVLFVDDFNALLSVERMHKATVP